METINYDGRLSFCYHHRNTGGVLIAGRIGFHELLGFRLSDVGSEHQRRLWVRGGFPRSYLATDDGSSALWRHGFIRTFLERDIPQLSAVLPTPTVRRMWTMLAHHHGGIVNHAALSRGLEVSQPTVTRWIDLLVQTFMVRTLRPWTTNTGKRLVKRPRLYLRDSGILHTLLLLQSEEDIISHPILGASWEGFALEETARTLGVDMDTSFFWKTHAGAEVDLLWERRGRRYAAEFKFSDAPKMTRSIATVRTDLALDHIWIVYPGSRTYSLDDAVTVVPLGGIDQPGSLES
ncbi:MAG: DUF4143 domain-containing protein [Spirochaeta sp.]|jgi:predicted AAA+ superfamily ATPase|nr:DUF4143 domain-containing protein [Spirochaeta sp.]